MPPDLFNPSCPVTAQAVDIRLHNMHITLVRKQWLLWPVTSAYTARGAGDFYIALHLLPDQCRHLDSRLQ